MTKSLSPEVKKELNALTLSIEFLVISVVQGMALQMLAGDVAHVFGKPQIEYWVYGITGFILILIFYSQSIIHALSFITWPIDLTHSFLYFLACFIEVLTFQYVTDPQRWFIFSFFFILVGGILYIYDLQMIKKSKKEFEKTSETKKLYEDIYTNQVKEMKFLVPLALIFNALAAILIYAYPTLFISRHYHIIFGLLQMLNGIVLLWISVKSCATRMNLITNTLKR